MSSDESNTYDEFEEALQSVRPKVQPRSQSMLSAVESDLEFPVKPTSEPKPKRQTKQKEEREQKPKAVMSRIPPEVAKGIEQHCLELDVSRDALIEAIFRQYLANPTKAIANAAQEIHSQRTLSKEMKRAKTMGSKYSDRGN